MKAPTALAIVALGMALPSLVRAEVMSSRPTKHGATVEQRAEWTLSADGYLAVNPTWWNVAANATVGFGDSVGEERRWSVTFDVEANDAYVTPAVDVELRVAPLLALTFEYRGFGFFGTNGALLDFGRPDAPYGDDAIDALIGTAAETRGYGQRLALAPTLRERLGPVALYAQGAVALYNLSDRPGVYLDWETDKLVREVDGVFLLRAAGLFVLHETKAFEVGLGPAWEVTAAGRTHLARQRIAALFGMRLLGAVRFGVEVGVNATDPNRQGQGFAVADLGVDLQGL